MKNKETFEQFGQKFQEHLAILISKDSSFSDQIQEVLEYNYFEHKYLQVFVKKIFGYKEKYKTHPSVETIRTILKTDLVKEDLLLQEQIKEFFTNIVLPTSTVENEEYVKDKSLDFCKKQTLKEAMLKSIDLLQKSSFDEISSTINNALKLGSDNNFGHDYLRDFELRYEDHIRNPISTGWQLIDNICQGGIGPGELAVCIAPTGVGKSWALVHLGTEALKQGKTVVHYTLELSDISVSLRYDSCLTGFPLTDIKLYKELVEKTVKEVPGRLIIKEYPTKSVSLRAIRNHLDKLENRGIKVDMIIIDYGDLLKPLSYGKERRFDLESVFEDMRALAQEKRAALWTASQTRRDSLHLEVITMESIAESFAKCFIADFIMSLSRTIEDKNSNGGRIYIAKNRFGSDGLVFPIFMDTSVSKMNVLDPKSASGGLVTETNTLEKVDVQNSHKEKYKSLLKERKAREKKQQQN